MNNNTFSHQWLSMQSEDVLLNISKKIKEFELNEEIVDNWFSNFDDVEQYELAIKIFFLIDFKNDAKIQGIIKTYKSQIDKILHKQNKQDIILISANDNVDSSNKFSYDLSKSWDTFKAYKKAELTDEIIKNKDNFFIFFNDTHGTGNQFVREFKDIINKIGQENCAIISIVMTDTALTNFKINLPNIGLIQPSFQSTKSISQYQNENKFDLAEIELLKQLGSDVYSKGILGYKNSGLLVAYSHQCPNNTLPIIWANGENNEVDGRAYPWKPLFEYKKVKEKISIPKLEKLDENLLTTMPPINLDFVGRTEELKEIKKNLDSNNLIYIVNGIGGIGKSELSYKYFHENKDKYNKIAFIQLSENNISLEDAFIIKFKEKFQLDTFDKIINKLQKFPSKNLLLIDNLEKREDFEKIKALNTNFDLLITTRLKDIDTKHQLKLETLNDEDAKELFLSIYSKDENIEDILIYLDNHPLFIELTAKALNLENITLDELRDDIKNNKISKIDSKDAKTFEQHLHKRFNKQFENEDDKELKLLLQTLAIFPSIEIKYEVFQKLLDDDKPKLQQLVHRGWLSKKDDTYKLHQIIKTFILTEHRLEYEELTYIFDNLSSYIDPYNTTIIASRLNHYIPVVDSFLNLFIQKEDNHIAKLYDSLTYLYYSLAKYDEAFEMQDRSLKIRKTISINDDKYIAKNYDLIGIIYASKDDYKNALEYFKKSLTIKEEVLESNHPDLALVWSNMSYVYKNTKYCTKAKEYFLKVQNIYKELDYKKSDLLRVTRELKEIERKFNQEKNLKFNKKGRFCKDYKELT